MKRDEFRFRIGSLFRRQDYWWVLAPPWTDEDWDNWLFHDEERPEEPVDETVSKVPAAVEDAINQIRRYVLPYFRKVAARHGVKLDIK